MFYYCVVGPVPDAAFKASVYFDAASLPSWKVLRLKPRFDYNQLLKIAAALNE